MRAELIFTGTELLLGQIINTNAQVVSRVLAENGIDIFYQVTVGDNLERLVATIRQAASRADLVIIGGGLGPTEDDLSREALSAAVGIPLAEDPEAMADITGFFGQRGYPMPANNRKQAMLPQGGLMMKNPIGTAPGVLLEHGGCAFALLPGPPREFKLMLDQRLMPFLTAKMVDKSLIRSRVLKICGLGESLVEERVSDLIKSSNPTLAPTAKLGEVHLRITAKTSDPAEAGKMISEMESKVRERVGSYLFGVDEETLEGVVAGMLLERKATIALAESCSGGLLCHRLTNVPGSSAYLMLGTVLYNNKWKESLVGVDPEVLGERGAVSVEVAEAMAGGIRKLAKTDIGVGITGIAGPAGGSPEKPVGLVYIAIDIRGQINTQEARFFGHRLEIKERAAQVALTLLWRKLAEMES